MDIKKNEIVEIKIKSITSDGNGVGELKNGMIVFVPHSAINDVLKVKILKIKKTYAFAKIEEVLSPSENRIESNCDISKKCGGCSFRHINYKSELKIKEQGVIDSINRIAGLDNIKINSIVPSKKVNRYRNKAVFPISEESIGFYAKHTHRIINCEDCKLQPEIFSKIVKIFKLFIKENNISIYNEKTHKGILRYLYIRIAETTQELMITVVINSNILPKEDKLIKKLIQEIPNLKNIVLNINTQKTNVILGTKCITLWGKDYIQDNLCDLKFNISPLSFYQVNRSQTETLYNIAKKYVNPKKEDTILDLYCGTGTIGLSIAQNVKKLFGIEIIPQAIKNAKENAELNNIKNAEFICSDVKDFQKNINTKINTIILDPPRKGCNIEVIKDITKIHPQKIVYISCNPSTLARDIKIFKDLDYSVKKLTPVDMFPRTGHVETVVLLGRENVDEVQYAYIDYETKDAEYLKGIKGSATYKEIKAWIKQEYDMNVTNLYIAQIKDKCGFAKRDNYNIGSESGRVPICPPEKEKAILGAFKHFGMV